MTRFELIPAAARPLRAPIPVPISTWDPAHPALRLFASREVGNLSRVVFRDAFAVEPGTDAAVLASLATGAPAIVAGRHGRGRTLLITNPCDREWTSWPAERIFVPLMQELFSYVGRLDDPAGNVRQVRAGIRDSRGPGVYPADAPAGKPLTVVTPDPREIDITSRNPSEFRTALGIGPEPGRTAWSDEDLPAGRERRDELWHWLALALLIVLVCETFLADRHSGRGRLRPEPEPV